jgi:short-subunit dehydrogenase
VQSFVQGVREELKDTGVSLTALMPGATETDFFTTAHMEDTEIGASEKDSPSDVAMQGFNAMLEGRDHVVGGSWKNTAEVLLARVTTESARAEQAGKGSKPGSAKETDSH